jgi:excisionase family DNA binding protein
MSSGKARVILDEPLLTARDVAGLLNLHYNTVVRMSDRGELPCFRVCARGDRRYRPADVRAYLLRSRR